MQLDTDKMIARKEDGVGWLIFNNPARRNAVSLAMREAMTTVFTAYRDDPDVRVMVMCGAGDKAFVSGADISEFKEKRDNAEAAAEYAAASARSTKAMADFDKPLIAMIRGFCIGGGLATALAADIRIASDDSQFAIPAAKLGLGYTMEYLRGLVDVVGPANASEILFAGRRMNAERALQMGLVNQVVTVDELEKTVRSMAHEIANNAPLTIKASKTTIRNILKDPSDRNLALIEQLLKDCFDSSDYKEGRAAFGEKRKPVFTGS
jgi:enoyl-CoA hydratase